jgi:hypothetical protein
VPRGLCSVGQSDWLPVALLLPSCVYGKGSRQIITEGRLRNYRPPTPSLHEDSPKVRKDVREFVRRLEAVGLTVEATPGHYRVLRDGKPLRKANGCRSCCPSPPTRLAGVVPRSPSCGSSGSTSSLPMPRYSNDTFQPALCDPGAAEQLNAVDRSGIDENVRVGVRGHPRGVASCLDRGAARPRGYRLSFFRRGGHREGHRAGTSDAHDSPDSRTYAG